jgi:hypothetical protein
LNHCQSDRCSLNAVGNPGIFLHWIHSTMPLYGLTSAFEHPAKLIWARFTEVQGRTATSGAWACTQTSFIHYTSKQSFLLCMKLEHPEWLKSKHSIINFKRLQHKLQKQPWWKPRWVFNGSQKELWNASALFYTRETNGRIATGTSSICPRHNSSNRSKEKTR